MKQLKVPADRIQLVLNKVEPDVGMDVAQVTRYFPQGFAMVIPYGREANRSLNMGMPVLAYAPDARGAARSWPPAWPTVLAGRRRGRPRGGPPEPSSAAAGPAAAAEPA